MIECGPRFDSVRQCFYSRGPCSVVPNLWIPAYFLRETEEKHNKEDGTEKTDAMEKRIKDKCDEMTDYGLMM